MLFAYGLAPVSMAVQPVAAHGQEPPGRSGTRVVSSASEGWPQGREWRVDSVPALQIGQLAGEPEYQFYRVSSVVMLPDGDVVVLDGGSRELRRYGPRGQLEWTAGREGSGPGELKQPIMLGQRPDGAFVISDRASNRITTVGLDGTILESRAADFQGTVPLFFGLFADGRYLATFRREIGPPPPGSSWADTISLWSIDVENETGTRITALPGPSWLWTGRAMLPVPFTANPPRALSGNKLFVSSGPHPEILVFDSDGRALERIVLERPPLPVRAADARRVVDKLIEEDVYGVPAEVWNSSLRSMTLPEFAPAFDRILVDTGGNIWARRYEEFVPSTSASWDVFRGSGQYLGAVATPARFEIFSVREGRIVGVFYDELGVEYVRAYDILRN